MKVNKNYNQIKSWIKNGKILTSMSITLSLQVFKNLFTLKGTS